jgi:DnaJ-class molecular chaperone
MTSHSRAAVDAIFAESFGFNSPNQNRKGTEFSNNRDGDGIVRSFEESVVVSAPGKDPAIKHTLSCSLEELYQGATKRVKITRQVADRRG